MFVFFSSYETKFCIFFKKNLNCGNTLVLRDLTNMADSAKMMTIFRFWRRITPMGQLYCCHKWVTVFLGFAQ